MAQFTEPQKTLLTMEDLERFKTSRVKSQLLGFIHRLQSAVRGTNRTDTPATENSQIVVRFLDKIEQLFKETPPLEQPMRFGNRAFTAFQHKVAEQGRVLTQDLLRGVSAELVERGADVEVNAYLAQSFGDPTRIDFGTGHELNFLCWCICLLTVGVLAEADLKALVHHVFWKYMEIMRLIQDAYKLEPAGSHGVWGLDDYHFLPFIFGAAELEGHPTYTPNSIHDDAICALEGEKYLYFHCILTIKRVKKAGHFGEHSPMLNDISAVPTWSKVATGLVKMYENEVLGKYPVMKHFLFGSLITFS